MTETEPGRQWAESRIKSITGGDRVQARLMHRDFFEFLPSCKLIIAGNHRPRLTGYGEAMRRRLHLIPCRATIPTQDRDRHRLAKLRRERGGILAWALAGCSAWQRIGLAPPEIVRAAASDYFDEEDLVGQWIADCCLVGQRERAASHMLFARWTAWAQKFGVGPGSAREFGERLAERGFLSFRDARSRGWSGLRLRQDGNPSATEGVELTRSTPGTSPRRSASLKYAIFSPLASSGCDFGSQAKYLPILEKVHYTSRPTRAVMQNRFDGELHDRQHPRAPGCLEDHADA